LREIYLQSLIAPTLDVLFPDTDEEDLEDIISVVKYLRIIRIFRSLNVVTRIHKIQLIWEAVVKTFSELIFITALMVIFFYIFAIIGIQVFERFTVSHVPGLTYRNAFIVSGKKLFSFSTLVSFNDMRFEFLCRTWRSPLSPCFNFLHLTTTQTF